MDKVSATALWVEKKNVYYNETGKITIPEPSALGIDNSTLLGTINKTVIQAPNGFRAKDGTRYGFGTFGEYTNLPYYSNEDLYFGGEILFEFEVFPHDLISELSKFDITFDIARRKKVNDYSFTAFDFIGKAAPSNATDGVFSLKNE